MLEDAFYQVKPSEPQPERQGNFPTSPCYPFFFVGTALLKLTYIYIYVYVYTVYIHIYTVYIYIYLYCVYIYTHIYIYNLYIDLYSICISTRLRHFWSQTPFSFRKSWGRRGSESRRKARTRRAEFPQFPHEMVVFKRGNFQGADTPLGPLSAAGQSFVCANVPCPFPTFQSQLEGKGLTENNRPTKSGIYQDFISIKFIKTFQSSGFWVELCKDTKGTLTFCCQW